MPLVRRLPYRRGFTNPSRVEYQPVNLEALARFPAGSVVDVAALVEARLVQPEEKVKILGDGELSHALTVRAHHFSQSARAKIEAAGGKAEELQHAQRAG